MFTNYATKKLKAQSRKEEMEEMEEMEEKKALISLKIVVALHIILCSMVCVLSVVGGMPILLLLALSLLFFLIIAYRGISAKRIYGVICSIIVSALMFKLNNLISTILAVVMLFYGIKAIRVLK